MDNAGLYVHVPFCLKKCIYCDFYSTTDLSKQPAFFDALVAEWKMIVQNPPFGGFYFDTLYFGGGTPSVLRPRDLKRVVVQFLPWLAEKSEITCEVNPATLTGAQLEQYRKSGINRLSVGIQSFDDKNLAFLSRLHTAQEAVSFIKKVKSAGFENWGIDLIFGIPGQTEKTWRTGLQRAVDLGPRHVSVYALTVEEGTPLARAVRRNEVQPCPDEVEAGMYITALEVLGNAGYEHYEISNFSRPGYRSRHNQKYWNGTFYLGLGPSAHSFDGKNRWWNCSAIGDYLEEIKHSRLPVAERESLDDEQRLYEFLLLGLRQSRGIDLDRLLSRFPAVSDWENMADSDTPPFSPSPAGHLLTVYKKHLCLTRQGLLLYNTVCEKLAAGI